MTSRERVRAAINHIEPDRIPMDLGATTVTGMAAGTMSKLRKALGLKEELVKVEEPFQILGKVEEDLRRTVQADVVGIFPKKTFLGFENSGWRPWKLQDGTDVLISKDMKYIYDTNGDILVYPQGNDSVRPSMRLPKGGFYFDTIVRQEEVDEENENGREDFREDYKVMSEEDLRFLEESTDNYYKNTDYALSVEQFLSGQAAMLNSGVWDTKKFDQSDLAKDIYYWWGPTFEDGVGEQEVSMKAPAHPYVVSARLKEEEPEKYAAVIDFLKFYYGKQGTEIIAKDNQSIPVTRYEGEIDAETYPVFARVITMMNDDWESPAVCPDMYISGQIINQYRESICGVINGIYTPREAVDYLDGIQATIQ